jgi:hypothetical protein
LLKRLVDKLEAEIQGDHAYHEGLKMTRHVLIKIEPTTAASTSVPDSKGKGKDIILFVLSFEYLLKFIYHTNYK